MRTVAQASRDASRRAEVEGIHSHWQSTVFPGPKSTRRTRSKSSRPRRGPWRHNLITSGAAGYTNVYDWLAAAMGSGPAAAFATIAAWASAAVTITGTTLTNSGAAFPTSGNGLSGQIAVAFGLTSQTIRYGVITSNTATALTVDQWYDATSTTGAAGATPTTSGGNATAGIGYIVIPGQNPAAWMCLSASVFAPANTDQSLNTQGAELTTNGFSRAVGTWAHSHGATTYTLIHLWTCSGGSTTINNEGISGAATILGTPNFGGVFPFESAEPSPPTLVSGDTIQNTVTITI